MGDIVDTKFQHRFSPWFLNMGCTSWSFVFLQQFFFLKEFKNNGWRRDQAIHLLEQ